jgi:hypothetical protein
MNISPNATKASVVTKREDIEEITPSSTNLFFLGQKGKTGLRMLC